MSDRPVVAFIEAYCPRCRRVTPQRVELGRDDTTTVALCNLCRPMEGALRSRSLAVTLAAATLLALVGGALATML